MRLSVASRKRENTMRVIKKETGLSNKQLAKYANVNESNMRQYKCGRKIMPKDVLIKLFFKLKESGYLTEYTLDVSR